MLAAEFSSSAFAVKSIKDTPAESGDIENFTCNLCATKQDAGGIKYKASSKFNNQADTQGTDVICPSCSTVTSGMNYILRLKNAVYSERGAIRIAKDLDLATFLLHPPKPPFLAVFGMTKQQHLVWRTPITFDEDLISFRLGDWLGLVDRKKVIECAKLYNDALSALNQHRANEKPKKKPVPSLFPVPTSQLRNFSDKRALMPSGVAMDVLNPDLDYPPALVAKMQKAFKALHGLTPIETFLFMPVTKFTDEQIKDCLNGREFLTINDIEKAK